jgi:hypothetical protein
MRWLVMLVAGLAFCACSTGPAPTPEAVLDGFRAAGLRVENVVTTGDTLLPNLQLLAPSCTDLRFEVGMETHGGRVVTCEAASDAATVARFYRDLGNTNASRASHIRREGALVLQMDGAVERSLFDQYVAALP